MLDTEKCSTWDQKTMTEIYTRKMFFFPGTEFLRCEMPVEMSVVSGPTVLLQSSDTGNGGVCHQYNSSKANIKGEG